ncbi:disulfide bond formation protein DsbA [Halobacteriales archaeon QS_8_69_26]|nr:MAG: disulfide bond formation protein DsbA [Halobacteriales archaeon QS_8_69_26]
MSDPDDTPLVVYSDYVCPFCYLGRASLEEYLAEAGDPPDVEWRPFDLRGHKRGPDGEIDHSVDDGKDEDYYEQARRNVERLSEQYGVEMDLDIARDVDSWNAQVASLYVRREFPDRYGAFHDAVFDALWGEGRDVGDPDVLADVAESVDLPPDEVRAAAADEDLAADLREEFEAARRVGITAVPTFVYGDHAARGAVPPEHLTRLVEGV